MSHTLSVADYRTLLHDALSAALAADTPSLSVPMMYTPNTHRAALYADSTVVRGSTGQGKTFWARALTDPQLRAVAAREYRMPRLERTEPVTGFSAHPNTFQPSAGELHALTGLGVQPTALWSAVALTAFGVPDLAALTTWTERVDWLVRNPGAVERSLAELEGAARAADTVRLVLFDALDQLHPDRAQAEHLASGMLNLSLTLSRHTTRLRTKIFIRPDMLDGALTGVPRAERAFLTARAADLFWGRTDYLGRTSRTALYGLFFHLLGNHDSTEAAAFRAAWPTWVQSGDGRFLAPTELGCDPKTQEDVFSTLVGRFMGDNARKGYTYTYLSCQLQDAQGTVTPRPFLTALATALKSTGRNHPEHDRPLHHDDLRRGVCSGARADELHQAMPWVRLALEPLAGQQLPIWEEKVLGLWENAELADRIQELSTRGTSDVGRVRTGPSHPTSYPLLLEELIEAGVLNRRTNGQLDMPGVYRIAHGLGRLGGVRRAAPAA
ncbi:hypothetical protein C9F11_43000 (plasmid) [Streptomyces sp. YIM 121038]|uniref:hypothetical protein n=1 Tax=Streptomyces sp. YIM 121038 TaxID=2136401 RepID=UPI00111087C7|nr:hypothetical protein [Streptomyces sp. YIM 121038]QCX82180.1 hypothetical protein C9F11_43000 [Streptomyces sp. YIM 121038]